MITGCTVWCVSFGIHFYFFSISRRKFYKFEDNWFLLYLSEVGMKLRFLFRILSIWNKNECFDKFTFPGGSDLYLKAFVIIHPSLKVFALFLERNSVPSTDGCCFEYGFLMRRPTGCFSPRDVFPYSKYV